MSEYDRTCYKNNFINQVIVRVDFYNYLPFEKIFNSDIEGQIKRHFPLRGKDQIIRFNDISLTINSQSNGTANASSSSIDGLQKEYRTVDGINKFILTNKFLVFEINKYLSFDEHIKWFGDIISAIFCENKIEAERTGIRYINIYDAEKIKLQKNYFSNEIGASLIIKYEQNTVENLKLVRSMHTNEYKSECMTLNFRYGMYNPHYPSVLKQNNFVLDYDCFSQELTESVSDVIRYIRDGHDMIQKLFENSITDAMRKVMGNG